MNKLPPDILLTQCLEANTFYNVMVQKHWSFSHRNTLQVTANSVMAEAYLMRAEALTQN